MFQRGDGESCHYRLNLPFRPFRGDADKRISKPRKRNFGSYCKARRGIWNTALLIKTEANNCCTTIIQFNFFLTLQKK